ncbi:M23 family metallopeptidase [Anabaena catenula]|uniref:Peptidoglycan DD-metalloendopeptidase family protein n=1 Tax=Anabaena catenula FACHB-362 TaxID=2692877 RepID=A0ABR8J510_9NOST|nr:M23 family metallopeptidase [Anabaena catenula]MBD2692743.1 peptidoglycan DD-metalloendopeptidase family protein [Anabaena catenula FACHB-362]
MTQRHKSAHNRLHNLQTEGLKKKRFASTLPAQSLCWLSSISLIGGGFVSAQMETSVDNIVPTNENSQPAAVAEPVKKATNEQEAVRSPSAPSSTQSQPNFVERRARLRKKLNREKVSQSKQPVIISQPKVENSEPAPTVRISKPKVENSEPKATVRISKPKVESSQAEKPQNTANSVPEKAVEFVKPANNSNGTASTSARKTQDYNNTLIDPTNYNNTATSNYEAPSSVIVTERAGGCRAVFSEREIARGACGKKAIDNPRVADSPSKSAPTWLRKSETASLDKAPIVQQIATESSPKTQSVVRTVASAVNNNRSWSNSNIGRSSNTKTAYRSNRFIPQPSEFATTSVSATPIAPSFGSLPAPMAEGNIAPRPSNVSYEFSLASVLPQIPYTGAVAYGGGMGNATFRGTGMMYPLSFSAPITSVFGWRIHPITGNRRFHAGTDIGAPTGTPILAAAKGQIETADWLGGYGLAVVINHSSAQQTLYGHMSEIFVRPGQWVEPGSVIGRVGSTGNSTGPHLHFEVRHLTANGWVAVDPGVQLQAGLSNLAQSTRTAPAQ